MITVLSIGVILIEGNIWLIYLELAYFRFKPLDTLFFVLELDCEVLELNAQLADLSISACAGLFTK